MVLYEYSIQISTRDKMPKWTHELIGSSFHQQFRRIRVEAEAYIERLKKAGFEIDWVRRRPYEDYEDVT